MIKKSRIALILAVSAAVLALLSSSPVFAQDCPTGYVWSRRSISCIQENCNEIPDAHYSYVLDCICGSSGSINEKPTDPNKECSYPQDYASCPGCTYACVHLDEPCPGEEVATTITAQPVTTIKSTTTSTTPIEAEPKYGDFVPDGPFNPDCTINQEEFDRDWLKYSDFDERIPLESRSREVQNYHNTESEIANRMVEIFTLRRDMEIDRLLRNEMRIYRSNLVEGHRNNIVKSIFRLAWVTYDTINAGAGIGRAYANIFTTTGVQQLGNALTVMNGLTPPNSSFTINTTSMAGKMKKVGVSAGLSAMTSLGDPVAAGQAAFQESMKQIVPTPGDLKISDQDVGILRGEHLELRRLDDVIQESYRINIQRKRRVEALEAEILGLQEQLSVFEEDEKSRIQFILKEDCKEQKRRFEEGG